MTKPARSRPLRASGCCLLLAGCSGVQSALDPAGPGAARIADVWWLMFWTCTTIFVAVLAALLWAFARRAPAVEPGFAEVRPEVRRERRMAPHAVHYEDLIKTVDPVHRVTPAPMQPR